MHDIKQIRQQDDYLTKLMKLRNISSVETADIIDLDIKLRNVTTKAQTLRTAKNKLAEQIAKHKKNNQDIAELITESEANKKNLQICEAEEEILNVKLRAALETLPNMPLHDVPYGRKEKDNIEIRKHGNIKAFNFLPKHHLDIGIDLNMLDTSLTANMSGTRFVTLIGKLAQLERALASFMIDMHTEEFGYTEISPPCLVRDHAMYGVGQLPKFAEDSFSTTNEYRLIPTGEVPLTNMVAESLQNASNLPIRYTACTPCFRSEAGSAGKDTRGMIRLHQFYKVELVSITLPEKSAEELERMTNAAETILKKLNIPYRVLLLCTGDMGFAAAKTYDLEAWFPRQNTYREISSCSNCTDFQARRLQARYKNPVSKKNYLLHTLNGSGLAVGRTLAAIMENYQNEDGSITIPKVLQPYMKNLEVIYPEK